MSGTPLAHEEAVLVAAVREAGAAIRERYEHGAAVYTKADNSPVTEADLEANAILTARLRAAFPADALLTEEEPPTPDVEAAPRCWFIDPLDGTASFVRHEPTFAVMVGLEVGGRPVVGAIYNPIRDELYTATAGGGARLVRGGGATEPLRFAPVPTDTARIGTAPASFKTLMEETPRWIGDPDRLLVVGRGFGFRPAAFANDRFDAYVGGMGDGLRGGGYPWDLIATDLIVHEAGGVFTDVFGGRYRYPRAHERMHGGFIGAKDPALHAYVLGFLRDAPVR